MRAKKAITITKNFLRKHMKTEEVRIGSELNNHIWSRGIKNPPGKVVVECEKTEQGIVYANLEGTLLREESDQKAEEQKPASEQETAEPQEEETQEETQTEVSLEEVKGLGPTRKQALKDAGITSAQQLAESDVAALSEVDGVGEATAEKILESAKKALQ